MINNNEFYKILKDCQGFLISSISKLKNEISLTDLPDLALDTVFQLKNDASIFAALQLKKEELFNSIENLIQRIEEHFKKLPELTTKNLSELKENLKNSIEKQFRNDNPKKIEIYQLAYQEALTTLQRSLNLIALQLKVASLIKTYFLEKYQELMLEDFSKAIDLNLEAILDPSACQITSLTKNKLSTNTNKFSFYEVDHLEAALEWIRNYQRIFGENSKSIKFSRNTDSISDQKQIEFTNFINQIFNSTLDLNKSNREINFSNECNTQELFRQEFFDVILEKDLAVDKFLEWNSEKIIEGIKIQQEKSENDFENTIKKVFIPLLNQEIDLIQNLLNHLSSGNIDKGKEILKNNIDILENNFRITGTNYFLSQRNYSLNRRKKYLQLINSDNTQKEISTQLRKLRIDLYDEIKRERASASEKINERKKEIKILTNKIPFKLIHQDAIKNLWNFTIDLKRAGYNLEGQPIADTFKEELIFLKKYGVTQKEIIALIAYFNQKGIESIGSLQFLKYFSETLRLYGYNEPFLYLAPTLNKQLKAAEYLFFFSIGDDQKFLQKSNNNSYATPSLVLKSELSFKEINGNIQHQFKTEAFLTKHLSLLMKNFILGGACSPKETGTLNEFIEFLGKVTLNFYRYPYDIQLFLIIAKSLLNKITQKSEEDSKKPGVDLNYFYHLGKDIYTKRKELLLDSKAEKSINNLPSDIKLILQKKLRENIHNIITNPTLSKFKDKDIASHENYFRSEQEYDEANCNILSLDLSNCLDLTQEDLFILLETFPKLRELTLCDTTLEFFSTKDKQSIVLPNLKKLSLKNCKNLVLIKIHAPELVNLNLEGCSKIDFSVSNLNCQKLQQLLIPAQANFESIFETNSSHLKTVLLKAVEPVQWTIKYFFWLQRKDIALSMQYIYNHGITLFRQLINQGIEQCDWSTLALALAAEKNADSVYLINFVNFKGDPLKKVWFGFLADKCEILPKQLSALERAAIKGNAEVCIILINAIKAIIAEQNKNNIQFLDIPFLHDPRDNSEQILILNNYPRKRNFQFKYLVTLLSSLGYAIYFAHKKLVKTLIDFVLEEVSLPGPLNTLLIQNMLKDKEWLMKIINDQLSFKEIIDKTSPHEFILLRTNNILLPKLILFSALRYAISLKKDNISIIIMKILENLLNGRSFFKEIYKLENQLNKRNASKIYWGIFSSSYTTSIELNNLSEDTSLKYLETVSDFTQINKPLDQDNNSPLCLAAKYNNLKLVRNLVPSGADLFFVNNVGDTPLMLACQVNALEIVKYLISQDKTASLILHKNHQANTALSLAISKNYIEIVNFILSVRPYSIKDSAYIKKLCLQAIAQGLKEITVGLYDYYCSLDKNNLCIFVEAAIKNNKFSIFLTLFQKQANIIDKGKEREWIDLAIASGSLAIFQYLDGVCHSNHINYTQLHQAVLNQDIKFVIFLCQKYPENINAKDANDETPLCVAVKSGNLKMVQLLCEQGANPLSKNSSGQLLPIMASQLNFPDIHAYLNSQIKLQENNIPNFSKNSKKNKAKDRQAGFWKLIPEETTFEKNNSNSNHDLNISSGMM